MLERGAKPYPGEKHRRRDDSVDPFKGSLYLFECALFRELM